MDDYEGAELVVERFINKVLDHCDYHVISVDNAAYP